MGHPHRSGAMFRKKFANPQETGIQIARQLRQFTVYSLVQCFDNPLQSITHMLYRKPECETLFPNSFVLPVRKRCPHQTPARNELKPVYGQGSRGCVLNRPFVDRACWAIRRMVRSEPPSGTIWQLPGRPAPRHGRPEELPPTSQDRRSSTSSCGCSWQIPNARSLGAGTGIGQAPEEVILGVRPVLASAAYVFPTR